MKFPIHLTYTRPHDARGWIGLGVYVLVLVLLMMMWADKQLLKDDFFKTIATLIIGTGFINGPVGWAYQATKAGGELAESSARIAEQAATAATASPAPQDAQDAAKMVATAAEDKKDEILGDKL